MESTVRAIESLVSKMEALTIQAGVEQKIYDKAKEFDPAMDQEEIKDRLTFLQDVSDREYRAVLDIWKLLPQEVWDRYKLLGQHNLREQRLLRDARKALKKVWGDKYGPSKSTTKPEGDPEPAQAE